MVSLSSHIIGGTVISYHSKRVASGQPHQKSKKRSLDSWEFWHGSKFTKIEGIFWKLFLSIVAVVILFYSFLF